MEYFSQAKFIRLRSRHKKYLLATSDGESVKQSRHGHTRQARWTVELVENKLNMIRLRSCYGKLLTATDEPYLLGWTGKKVALTVQTNCNPSVHWEPTREDYFIKLQSPISGKFLRGNGGTLPWKNTVTIDVPERSATKDWVLWEIDILDADAGINADNCGRPKNANKCLSLQPSANNFGHNDSYKSSYSMATTDEARYSSSASSTEAEDDDSELPETPTSIYAQLNKAAMDLFNNAKTIRLRSHHDKYLMADDDQESVIQDRHASSKRARWTVEYVKSVEGGQGVSIVRFKSCYDKYLTATDDDFFMQVTGKKVKQTVPSRLDSSIEWEPIRDGMQVKLKTRYGNFLRANGGVPPWRNSITHDVPSRSHTQDWILWDIEVVEVYQKQDEVTEKPELKRSESEFDSSAFRSNGGGISQAGNSAAPKREGRVIHYNVVDDDGNVVEGENTIDFKGNGVEELTKMLEEVTGMAEITVCSRSPLNGNLYPMKLALPPIHVKVHVFVVPSSSKAAKSFASS